MRIEYSLTPELRAKLKEPLGTLILGSFNETVKVLKDTVKREKPPRIISVGDTVSRNLAHSQISAQLMIVDNLTMRKSIQPISAEAERSIHVKNPQGTITDEAIGAIRESLKHNEHAKIVVDGEEDLLALVAILHAPENSLVVYGQPRKGIVVVRVTPEKKSEIAEILKGMENVRKAK
jgi:uncharacterized protein (UPF0218 family)